MNFNSLLRSIRLRILVLYLVILVGTFSVFGILVYSLYLQQNSKALNSLLETKARGISNSLKTYLATQTNPEPVKGFLSLFVKPPVQTDKFGFITGYLTEGELTPSDDEIEVFVDIFDSYGNLIESTGAMSAQLMLTSKDLAIVTTGASQWKQVELSGRGWWPVSVRLLRIPVIDGGRLLYVVQTRASFKPIDNKLRQIGGHLFLIALITLLITGWAGLLLVKLTLHPVERMVRKIRSIGPANLGTRVVLPHTDDEIHRLAMTFNDMLDRLEKSFVSQRQMIQNISHELKTPLTIMRGEFEVALKKSRTPEEYGRIFHSGLEEIHEMQAIIDGLLTLARIDAAAGLVETEKLDLSELVKSVVDDISALAQNKQIEIITEIEPNVQFKGHKVFLRRLMMNLLDNAIKYTPAKGKIKLELNRVESEIKIVVGDNGIGIPEKDLPHIFERFSRGERGRTNDGYGLGLSIVHSIVRAHRGRIQVRSTAKAGTHFEVYLPVREF